LRKAGVDVDKNSTQESNASNAAGPVAASSVDPTTAAVPKRKASPRRTTPNDAVTVVSNPSTVGEKGSSPEGSGVSLPNVQKARPVANTTETAGTNSADAASSRKPKASLSPQQLIDSPKTDAPRKSKVIQWP
jgi:hypothetical protein